MRSNMCTSYRQRIFLGPWNNVWNVWKWENREYLTLWIRWNRRWQKRIDTRRWQQTAAIQNDRCHVSVDWLSQRRRTFSSCLCRSETANRTIHWMRGSSSMLANTMKPLQRFHHTNASHCLCELKNYEKNKIYSARANEQSHTDFWDNCQILIA